MTSTSHNELHSEEHGATGYLLLLTVLTTSQSSILGAPFSCSLWVLSLPLPVLDKHGFSPCFVYTVNALCLSEVPNYPYVHTDSRSKGCIPRHQRMQQFMREAWATIFSFPQSFFVLVPTCFASHISPGAICLICAHSYGVVYLLRLINTKLHTNIYGWLYPHIILNRFWMEVFQLLPLNTHTVFTFNTYTPWQWDVRYNTCCAHTYLHYI